MDVSPKSFREVEFREKMRGYHPEDVDQFLDQAASGVEALLERVRQAESRSQRAEAAAQRAEAAAAETGTSDETLRRTLVLAQRTADLAVQEARDQAARIVAAAEQQSRSIVGEAEERARRLHGEALADVHAELAKLEAVRSQAQTEVDNLTRWTEEHRIHLRTTLSDAVAMLDRAELLSPPPSSTPIDVPFARRSNAGAAALPLVGSDEAPPAPAALSGSAPRPGSGAGSGPGAGSGASSAPRPSGSAAPPPESASASGTTNGASSAGSAPAPSASRPPAATDATTAMAAADVGSDADAGDDEEATGSTPVVSADGGDDKDAAMESFFEGQDNDLDEEPRFGGRLRRRR